MEQYITIVRCPFFHKRKPRTIVCEGVRDQMTSCQNFPTQTMINTYMRVYCCHEYHRCYYYKALMLKWQEGIERET